MLVEQNRHVGPFGSVVREMGPASGRPCHPKNDEAGEKPAPGCGPF